MIAVVIGLTNAIAKPIFLLRTLPITILTLGLFLPAVNGIMLCFAGRLFSDLRVEGAILG